MPHGRNPASEARKRHIVSLLEYRLGPLDQPYKHRTDWHSPKDRSVEVFITDSKPHPNRRRWYDMAHADIEALAKHSAGFIIFVLGYKDNFLVIPAKDLLSELQNYQPSHATEDGRYHLNLNRCGNAFEQIPNWELHRYADKIELVHA